MASPSSALSCLLGLLAACQAAADGGVESSQWRRQIERSQVELRQDVELLRASLGQRVVEPAAMVAGSVHAFGGAVESASTTELNARLAALADQVALLNATLAAAGPARPADASDGRPFATTAEARPMPDMAPLQQALRVLEQQHALHCENIANVDVPGYKLRRLEVSSELHGPSGLRLPKAGRVTMVMSPGTLEITERSLDVALDGDGFFVVRAADGVVRYTRDGHLQLNAHGQLVTRCGAVLVTEVVVPSDTLEISIDPMGCVSGRRASSPDAMTVFGRLQLARFPDPEALVPVRDGLLGAAPEAGEAIVGEPGAAGFGVVEQGFVERSNVQVTSELIDLQVVQRQLTVVRRVLAGHGIYTR